MRRAGAFAASCLLIGLSGAAPVLTAFRAVAQEAAPDAAPADAAAGGDPWSELRPEARAGRPSRPAGTTAAGVRPRTARPARLALPATSPLPLPRPSDLGAEDGAAPDTALAAALPQAGHPGAAHVATGPGAVESGPGGIAFADEADFADLNELAAREPIFPQRVPVSADLKSFAALDASLKADAGEAGTPLELPIPPMPQGFDAFATLDEGLASMPLMDVGQPDANWVAAFLLYSGVQPAPDADTAVAAATPAAGPVSAEAPARLAVAADAVSPEPMAAAAPPPEAAPQPRADTPPAAPIAPAAPVPPAKAVAAAVPVVAAPATAAPAAASAAAAAPADATIAAGPATTVAAAAPAVPAASVAPAASLAPGASAVAPVEASGAVAVAPAPAEPVEPVSLPQLQMPEMPERPETTGSVQMADATPAAPEAAPRPEQHEPSQVPALLPERTSEVVASAQAGVAVPPEAEPVVLAAGEPKAGTPPGPELHPSNTPAEAVPPSAAQAAPQTAPQTAPVAEAVPAPAAAAETAAADTTAASPSDGRVAEIVASSRTAAAVPATEPAASLDMGGQAPPREPGTAGPVAPALRPDAAPAGGDTPAVPVAAAPEPSAEAAGVRAASGPVEPAAAKVAEASPPPAPEAGSVPNPSSQANPPTASGEGGADAGETRLAAAEPAAAPATPAAAAPAVPAAGAPAAEPAAAPAPDQSSAPAASAEAASHVAQESGARDSVAHEPAAGAPEAGAKEPAAKEPGTQEAGAKEAGVTTSGAQEHAAQEHAAPAKEGSAAPEGAKPAETAAGETAVPPLPESSAPALYIAVRQLQRLQDRIATGKTYAVDTQNELLAQIQRQFLKADPSAWQDPRNARALVIFALSGGNPRVLRAVLKQTPLPAIDERLLLGSLAFLEGRESDAIKLLGEIDVKKLPPSLAGHVALAQAALWVRRDPARAGNLLTEARLVAPGTLVEEGALRRQILVAAQANDVRTFERLSSAYLIRFRHSVYAGNFRQRFASAITRMNFVHEDDGMAHLEDLLGPLDVDSRLDIALMIAKASIVQGKTRTAQRVADRVTQEAVPGSLVADRARLYHGAALATSAEGFDQALAELGTIAVERLSRSDAALLAAAVASAETIRRAPEVSVVSPPPVAAPAAPAPSPPPLARAVPAPVTPAAPRVPGVPGAPPVVPASAAGAPAPAAVPPATVASAADGPLPPSLAKAQGMLQKIDTLLQEAPQ
ncbi:hypothetical protein [Ancylobacter lacus]|uniref:hypothetical protein n=1 Tax=Ancylobacter lacus TaxID=2579970 RepID=UPI001BD0E414|nr:hypothetical protein [Ancylobacter lacus]MBS7537932.1 hypothetical protein [Ancylobacter lacus]